MKSEIFKMKKSYINQYDKLISEVEQKEKIKIYKLNIGQPDIKTDKSYFYGLRKFVNKINKYGECKGEKKLRIEFSNYYNERLNWNKYNEDNIQITLGASDAIINVLSIICNKGDYIFVLEPFFSDYKMYCNILGVNIIGINIKDLVEEKINNKYNCKAILFSHPNNPDGHILSKKERQKILEFAINNNLYIISDEVYNEIVFNDNFISMSVYNYNKIIIIDSISKKFSNCGARIGALITENEKILENIVKIYDARIAISNAEQYAIINMFQRRKRIIKKILKIYRKRKQKIEEYLKNQSIIKYQKPDGGTFFLLDLPIQNAEKFAEWVLKTYRNNNKTVCVLPANDFYKKSKKNNQIRLTITNNSKYTIEALKLLEEAIFKYKKEVENE